MSRRFDVLIIGTGTAAYNVALPCAGAGLSVATVDARAYGGTCARRGCQPKKFLVAAAEAVGHSRDLTGRGIETPATLHWADLIRATREFTAAVPARTERRFEQAGITLLSGRARFVGPAAITIDGADAGKYEAAAIVIATGARPRRLDVSGAGLLTTSEDFLELDALPPRMVCVGGGYISLEFAHVAARAGAAVSIVHAGPRLLEQFDADLVRDLTDATSAAGIEVHTSATVVEIVRDDDALLVRTEDGREFPTDLALHGAGRVPDLAALDLAAAGVEAGDDGVTVDDGLRSVTNRAVFAVGDAADRGAKLAPVADLDGAVAADNIVAGRTIHTLRHEVIPSVVFTQPPLAAVGMTAADASARGDAVVTSQGDMRAWPTSRRLGQQHAAYKVFQDASDGRILGAHLLGPGVADTINLFALAMAHGLTGKDLRRIPWAYPTASSDLKNMVVDPQG
jgi:glutathione reductase (NADPH)